MKYGLAAFFMQKMEGIFMATKNKIINIKVFFDGDQDASPCGGEIHKRSVLIEIYLNYLRIFCK